MLVQRWLQPQQTFYTGTISSKAKLCKGNKHIRINKPQKTNQAVASASQTKEAPLAAEEAQPISLSSDALRHLKRLREDSGGEELLLRVGVKAGGCSGMSYTMDFEDSAKIAEDDTIMDYSGFKLVSDPMSLLYLFGMTLDYSNKLIGGGFIFQNPNAQSSCGCGKSFGV